MKLSYKKPMLKVSGKVSSTVSRKLKSGGYKTQPLPMVFLQGEAKEIKVGRMRGNDSGTIDNIEDVSQVILNFLNDTLDGAYPVLFDVNNDIKKYICIANKVVRKYNGEYICENTITYRITDNILVIFSGDKDVITVVIDTEIKDKHDDNIHTTIKVMGKVPASTFGKSLIGNVALLRTTYSMCNYKTMNREEYEATIVLPGKDKYSCEVIYNGIPKDALDSRYGVNFMMGVTNFKIGKHSPLTEDEFIEYRVASLNTRVDITADGIVSFVNADDVTYVISKYNMLDVYAHTRIPHTIIRYQDGKQIKDTLVSN